MTCHYPPDVCDEVSVRDEYGAYAEHVCMFRAILDVETLVWVFSHFFDFFEFVYGHLHALSNATTFGEES